VRDKDFTPQNEIWLWAKITYIKKISILQHLYNPGDILIKAALLHLNGSDVDVLHHRT
jgi:hypothetical protein